MHGARSKSLVEQGTRARCCALAACVLSSLLVSNAQAADPASDSKPAGGDKTGEQQPSRTLESLQKETVNGAPEQAPPPASPKADQQEPRPYVRPVELQGKERHVTLMAVAGVWQHGFNGKSASSSVGPVWGFSGRVDPYEWLGVRLSILRGNQPVTPDAGALTRPGLQVEQPDFQVIHWMIRMEPTWHVTSAFSLWAGVGLGWARAIAPEPRISESWRSADRACVYVEGQWALGAQYEVIRDWLLLDLDLSAGALGYQKGSAHDPIQGFTTDGHRTHIGGYPDFSRKVQALLGIGVIL
jgi:opacity protein-like surface antigen